MKYGVDYKTQELNGHFHIHILGTNHKWEWLINCLALPVKTSIGWVHIGWYLFSLHRYLEIRRLIGDKVYSISGHSLGAPIALYYAAMLSKAGAPPILVDTFGSPRPGWIKKSLKEVPVFRYKTTWDIVPYVPFWFPHIGMKVKIESKIGIYKGHQPAAYQPHTEVKL